MAASRLISDPFCFPIMAKDPAFLFFSKDWLEGTAEMTPAEKGVYIDLLAHQHQKGSLPPETVRLAKMVGLAESEFLPIWEHIKVKFPANETNRLVNQRLTEVVTDRLTKSLTNRITGTLASVIRLNKVGTPEQIEKIKKQFKVTDFLTVPNQNLTERLTEWLYIRLKSIANANEYENGNESITVLEGGAGGRVWQTKPGEEAHGLVLLKKSKKAAIELYYHTNQVPITDEQADNLWEIFKHQHFNGEQYYPGPGEAYKHFINWMKNQKINGTYTNQRSNGKAAPVINNVAKGGFIDVGTHPANG